MEKKNRNNAYDILKFLGLLCIILAHINPPSILFQIRNFDVILMMIVSALLFFDTNNEINSFKEYCIYVWKRFKRLVVPTWIFLTIYFIIRLFILNDKIELKTIITSYTLYNGIGFVWIIRIYLIEAMLLPLFCLIIKKYKIGIVVLAIISIYVLYEIMYIFNLGNYNKFFYEIIAYIFPILLIILTSYILFLCKNKRKCGKYASIVVIIISFIIFLLMGLYYYKTTNIFQNTNYAKYPFRSYYLSYAIFMSYILFFICNEKYISIFGKNRIIQFISKSSLWIYLWHILFLRTFECFKFNWIIYYLLVLSFSIMITYIQNIIIDKLEKLNISKKFLKVFRG